MQKTELDEKNIVYGLDIGTRSVVGSVGYLERDTFIVLSQAVREHETRAMIDGQIHDIGAVSRTIKEVTRQLEESLDMKLSYVCIAAAGRVLRTLTIHAQTEFESEKVISKEDIYALDSYGIQLAYEQFQKENNLDMKFYCVGYTVMHYYQNNYPISNLENHKAKVIAEDLIATFLPDDVVDGLYKAVELANLHVRSLTLEPIAAMEVAIPQMYRLLNIALIDVGAGTSDISITRDGTIVAYGMLPVAGDKMTEDIARHCLVDFGTAEMIKKGIETQSQVEYKDIMGLTKSISSEEVLSAINDSLEQMTDDTCEKILELNAGKPVSAVFVVGGGGKIDGYTDLIAEKLGIAKERCALRGEDVMQKVVFKQKNIIKDSMLVTPIGICINYYEQNNNFMFVTFNDKRIKMYDNTRLSVVDAAIAAEFSNEDLFAKRGDALHYMLNGVEKTVLGNKGESAFIYVNDEKADLHTLIRANDIIKIQPSTKGSCASLRLGDITAQSDDIHVMINGTKAKLPRLAIVNHEFETSNYEIKEGDEVEFLSYYTVDQVFELMDITDETQEKVIFVNRQRANGLTKVYDNFVVETNEDDYLYNEYSNLGDQEYDHYGSANIHDDGEAYETYDTRDAEDAYESKYIYGHDDSRAIDDDNKIHNKEYVTDAVKEYTGNNNNTRINQGMVKQGTDTKQIPENETTEVVVLVNNETVVLSGRKDYIYVDVFDHIDFDLSVRKGKRVETLINGRKAQYTETLHTGDVLEIFWKD